MRWPITLKLPKVFGWGELSFADRLKLMAFLAQAGAGVAMTGFAGYAMVALAELRAVWPLFYLGAGALILVGIVVTGLAALLIVRQLEIHGPGGFRFVSRDAGAKGEEIVKEMQNVQSPDK